MDKLIVTLLTMVVFVSGTVLFSFLMAFPVYLVWNAVIPELFHLQEITWGQAWALNLLCGFLFNQGNTNKFVKENTTD